MLTVVPSFADEVFRAAGEALSTSHEAADVFLRPSESRLWSTVIEPTRTIPVMWPAGAISARVTAAPVGAFAGLDVTLAPPADSCEVAFPRPRQAADEYVVELKLRFYTAEGDELTGSSATASLGVVCSEASFSGTDVAAADWQTALKTPVIPVPPKTASVAVTREGVESAVPVRPPSLWAQVGMKTAGDYALAALDAAGEALAMATVSRYRSKGALLIVR